MTDERIRCENWVGLEGCVYRVFDALHGRTLYLGGDIKRANETYRRALADLERITAYNRRQDGAA